MPEVGQDAVPQAVIPPAIPAEILNEDQNLGGEAPPTDPEGQAAKPVEQPTPEQEAKRQGRRFERKLDASYRREAEARARAELLERELTELKQARAQPVDPTAPRLEDFSDVEEFRKAVEKHGFEKGQKEAEARRQYEARSQYTQKLTSSWEAKAEAGAAKYEDFDEKVGELTPNMPMTHALMEADNAADIAYYLATHMDEAKQIAGLSPAGQIRAIGRLEAKLEAQPPTPRTPSSAPAPITPVKGAATITKDPKDMTDAEFAKWRKAQIKARGN